MLLVGSVAPENGQGQVSQSGLGTLIHPQHYGPGHLHPYSRFLSPPRQEFKAETSIGCRRVSRIYLKEKANTHLHVSVGTPHRERERESHHESARRGGGPGTGGGVVDGRRGCPHHDRPFYAVVVTVQLSVREVFWSFLHTSV